MAAFDPNDGGFLSRKFIVTIVGLALIFGGAFAAAHWTVAGPIYDTMVGGIVGLAGVFMTGNIAGKWAIGKNVVAAKAIAKDDANTDPLPKP